LLKSAEDGRIKLFVTSRALRYRRAHRDLFLSGAYLPLEALGRQKNHIVGFMRERTGHHVIAACARFFLKLNPAGEWPIARELWGDTVLLLPKAAHAGCYRDILTDRTVHTTPHAGRNIIPAPDLFSADLPAALLEPSLPTAAT
jgi:(1->4)-alpha-D-glucan 1-alpha-D-glucosylmutase